MSITTCCRDATALLTESAEGALEGVEKLSFAFHLTVCGPCRRYREQLETTKSVLKAIPREEPKPDKVDAILALLEADATAEEEDG